MLEFMQRVGGFSRNIAVEDWTGVFNYNDLLCRLRFAALNLLDGKRDLSERRVAFIIPPGFSYAALKLGIWAAGGVSVPIGIAHSPREIKYAIEDSGADTVVFHPETGENLFACSPGRSVRVVSLLDVFNPREGRLPCISEKRRAMIIYTSGTTSSPKGVVSTHLNIKSQISSMTSAWEWSPDDSILNVLPLHHLHGILNVVLCSLWSGARCVMLNGFNSACVWERFRKKDITLFTAVPTIYSKLIDFWENSSPEHREIMSASLRGMRLMVSGSAALPVAVLDKWKEISGHVLLERYGMTELGMVFSNPYRGIRLAGRVGCTMPGVEAGIFTSDGRRCATGEPGEIRVKGDSVFLEYWGRRGETEESFCDGWFKTGDIAVFDSNGCCRILGRKSQDIIKSGGYKISALEIEEVLREHHVICECAVVGVPDSRWGERIAVALEIKDGCSMEITELREWASDRLVRYKIPSVLRIFSSLPRNLMGKVKKNEIKEFFQNSL